MNLRRFVDRFFARNAAPEPANVEARDPALVTLVSIIYSTAPKTFTGDAVYVTMSSSQATGTGLTVSKPTSTADDEDDSSSSSSSSSSSISKSSAKSTSGSTSKSSSSSPQTTTPPTTPSSSTSTNSAVAATITPSETAAASSGMSGGAKAGLAFGLIILIALIAGAIFFFLRKRKENHESHERLDDEKAFLALGRKPDSQPSHGSPFTASTLATTARGTAYGGVRSEKLAPQALATDDDRHRFSYEEAVPRLNLRAVSQFNPGFSGTAPAAATSAATAPGASPSIPAAAATAGAVGAVGATAAVAAASKNSLASDPNNPFGNHAEKLSNSPPQHVPLPASPSASSFGRASPGPQAADFPLPESGPATPAKKASPTLTKAEVATGAAVGTAAIAAATAAAASNKPLVSGASSPGGSVAENVHRVQLDFMPSMEDELEIRAGQLVRVVHEYDDGWALCSRMDRSRQGVVPRTCLSKHSVKPRPQSPSRPGPRGPPPGVRPGGPPFAQSPRPLSPSGPRSPGAAPHSQSPRPLTPTGGRNRSNSSALPQSVFNPANVGQSPNGGSRSGPPQGVNTKGRSNSMSNVGGISRKEVAPSSKIPAPIGQVPSRKPVPGQS